MTEQNNQTDFIQSQNKDRIYQQKKLEGLDNAINSLIKWKEDHKFCLMGDELTDLNDIINDLTDRFIDLKDNNKQ
jgi:hypothetical protein